MLFKLIKKKECFGHFKLTNLVKTKLYNKKLTIKCITKLKAHKNTSIVYKIETDKE